jgi:hypothetical protein
MESSTNTTVNPEDLIKFVTGLSSGAVALIATLAIRTSSIAATVAGGYKISLVLALIGFGLAIFFAMTFYVDRVRPQKILPSQVPRRESQTIFLCSLGFLLGVVSLIMASILAIGIPSKP